MLLLRWKSKVKITKTDEREGWNRDLDVLPSISAIDGSVSYDVFWFLIQIGFTEVTQKSVCVVIRRAWIQHSSQSLKRRILISWNSWKAAIIKNRATNNARALFVTNNKPEKEQKPKEMLWKNVLPKCYLAIFLYDCVCVKKIWNWFTQTPLTKTV